MHNNPFIEISVQTGAPFGKFDILLVDQSQVFLIGFRGMDHGRINNFFDWKGFENFNQAADMIGMRMGGDNKIQFFNPLLSQVIGDDRPSRTLSTVNQNVLRRGLY